MVHRRRRTVVPVLVVSVVVGLTACTPGVPYAWRLNSDGSVSFSFCDSVPAEKIELVYLAGATPVAEVVAAGASAAVGGGVAIHPGPSNWLIAEQNSPSASWDRFEFDVLAAERLPGYFGNDESTRADGLLPVESSRVERSELRLNEWVWDSGYMMGKPSCGITEEVAVDSMEQAESVALVREAFDALLAGFAATGSTDELVLALTAAGSPAPIVAFQTRILLDLRLGGLATELPLRQALASIYGEAVSDAILFAAPAAAARLGYDWNPDAVPLNGWAQATFPDALIFSRSLDPFDQILR